MGEIAKGYSISFQSRENVLPLVVMVAQLCDYTKTTKLHILKG